jgi:hypothetical protein
VSFSFNLSTHTLSFSFLLSSASKKISNEDLPDPNGPVMAIALDVFVTNIRRKA